MLDLTRERRDIDTNNEARNTVIYGTRQVSEGFILVPNKT